MLTTRNQAVVVSVNRIKRNLRERIAEPGGISSPEKRRLLNFSLGLKIKYSKDKTIHELFEEQVRRLPNKIAVIHNGQAWSYEELNSRANRLAHTLRQVYQTKTGNPLKPNTPVGLCVNRGIDMVVGMIAILKSGGAYVPLSPEYPTKRLQFMLEDAGIQVVISQQPLNDGILLPSLGDGAVMVIDADEKPREDLPRNNLNGLNKETDTAYIIYTSGSTGTPKGVCVSHRAVHNFLVSASGLHYGENDTIAQMANHAFDAATFEIWGALLTGGTTVIIDSNTVLDPDRLLQTMTDNGVTVAFFTTALFNLLAENKMDVLTRLKCIHFGGEMANPFYVKKVLTQKEPGAALIHVYGPTECTTYSTFCELTEKNTNRDIMPIGRPLGNYTAYVLDEQQRLAPVGVPGELYIGGDSVAVGYLHRPELSEERFVPNPFATVEDRRVGVNLRLYKTGDLVRWQPDGSLQILGRTDFQVKIRGFRIEPEEVERTLLKHPDVRQCVVIPWEGNLVAYWVSGKPLGVVSPRDLRSFLLTQLPEYMVPSLFRELGSFPLNPNGKINRQALPAPFARQVKPAETTPREQHGQVNPEDRMDNLTREVCKIVAKILNQDRLGIHESIFHYGAHSLIVCQICTTVRDRLRTALEPREVFEHPTVAGMARLLSTRNSTTARVELPIPRAPRTEPIPLTYQQEQIWFLNKLAPDNRAYNSQFSVRFHGPLDKGIFEKCLTEIVRRHEILRTTFPEQDGTPVQVIHEPWKVNVPEVDLRHLPKGRREEDAERLMAKEMDACFDCNQLPLFHSRLYRIGEDDWVFLHVEHHFIHDGWEVMIFLRELQTLYVAFLEGRESPLEELPIQYADHAAWQKKNLTGTRLEEKVQYWVDKIRDYPHLLNLPFDHPRPEIQTFRGDSFRVNLDGDLYRSLREFSLRHNVTLFMTMYSVFAVLLARCSGQEKLLVGTGVANRCKRETENLMGMFVNMVPLYADLSGNPTFEKFLNQTRQNLLEDARYQDTPFPKIVERLKVGHWAGHNPVFQVIFAFHDSAVPVLDFAGIRGTIVERHNKTAKTDMNLICIPRVEQHVAMGPKAPHDEDMTLIWEYNSDLFDRETVQKMIADYVTLLQQVVENPIMPVGAPGMFSATEQRGQQKFTTGSQQPGQEVEPILQLLEETAKKREYVAPRNKTEKALAATWENLLQIGRIGVHDSFFELGGNSILTVRMLGRVKNELGVSIDVANMYSMPTIAALAAHIDAKALGDLGGNNNLVLALKDAQLEIPESSSAADARVDHPRHVLLTGATGFLGFHLLDKFLTLTDAQVHCLVRGADLESVRARFRETLRYYGRSDLDGHPRITLLKGDLKEPLLGLPEEVLKELEDMVDHICHCGALVHHLFDYRSLRRENVLSTCELAKIALRGRRKVFNFISTLSVASYRDREGRIVEVESGNRPISTNGYVMTKWAAEKILLRLAEKGLPVNIFRPGNIIGHSKTGICVPEKNHALLLVKGCLQMNCAPDWKRAMEMTPVDKVAEAIVQLLLNNRGTSTFNMNNPQQMDWVEYIGSMRKLGIEIPLVSVSEWQERLGKIDESNALFPLKDFYLKKRGDWIDPECRPLAAQDSLMTQAVLQQLGAFYPQGKGKYMPTFVGYLKNTGFFPC